MFKFDNYLVTVEYSTNILRQGVRSGNLISRNWFIGFLIISRKQFRQSFLQMKVRSISRARHRKFSYFRLFFDNHMIFWHNYYGTVCGSENLSV